MKYRTLGRTGLEVSLASLGTGGPSRIGQWTHQDESQSQRVIHRALELGINIFDTAADYSDSEEILGRTLKDVPRDDVLIATKFTPYVSDGGPIIEPDQVVASCERSLRRLQRDTIDIFQFHGVLPDDYRESVDRLYPTVEKLRDQGKIRFTGITEFFYKDPSHEMLIEALEEDIWDTIMVKYGMLNMSAEARVLPMAEERNVGVFNMSAVRVKVTRPGELEKFIANWKDKGLLAQDALPDKGPLDFLVHDGVPSVIAAGYKFGIEPRSISTLLIGTGNVAHLEENIGTLLGPPLPATDSRRLRGTLGHIAESEADGK